MEKTIARVGYVPITARSNASYTYAESITYFDSAAAGGRNVKATPRGETFEIYADGLPVIAGEVNAGYDIDIELISIIDDIEEHWLGNTKLTNGVLEKVETAERPHFALVVVKELFNGSKKYAVDFYFDAQVAQRPDRNSKTSEKNFDPEFPTFKLAAVPRLDNKFVKYTDYTDTIPTAITTPTLSGAGGGNV